MTIKLDLLETYMILTDFFTYFDCS